MMEYVVAYIFTLISFFSHIVFYKNIKDIKYNLKIKFLFFALLIPTIAYFLSLLKNPVISIFTNLLFSFLLIKIVFKITLKEGIYFSIIINIVCMFSDALISIVIGKSGTNFFINFYKNYIFRSLLTIPVFLLSFVILTNKKSKLLINKVYNKFINQIKITKKFLVLIIFIVCSFIMFCWVNAYRNVNGTNHFIMTLGIFIFIILFIILLVILYREYQIELCNQQIIEENNYIKSIAQQDEEFKHNLINNLLAIKTVSNKKTNKLIDELISDYKQDYKNITNINDLPNGVQSIIYRKAYEENIEDLNLIVDNSINKELYDLLKPKQYNHLCTAIGILFDNALDAVRNTNEKVIEIIFLEDNENIYFILKNSFSSFIDLEEIGKKSVTTKIGGHGIGVNYISKLKTLNIKNEIINNMFVSKLIIRKSKKYS